MESNTVLLLLMDLVLVLRQIRKFWHIQLY